jgi:hypothetical protein
MNEYGVCASVSFVDGVGYTKGKTATPAWFQAAPGLTEIGGSCPYSLVLPFWDDGATMRFLQSESILCLWLARNFGLPERHERGRLPRDLH